MGGRERGGGGVDGRSAAAGDRRGGWCGVEEIVFCGGEKSKWLCVFFFFLVFNYFEKSWSLFFPNFGKSLFLCDSEYVICGRYDAAS